MAKPRKQRPEQSEERDPCRQHSLKQHSGDRPGTDLRTRAEVFCSPTLAKVSYKPCDYGALASLWGLGGRRLRSRTQVGMRLLQGVI